MKRKATMLAALFVSIIMNAQELVTGGQFMDLLLPMEGSVAATSSDWGTSAGENTQYSGTWEGTLGRWKDNGIEDTDRSYWGGNIVRGSDGKYHIYVAGWPSATCGHMQWSSKSMVYHVMSDNEWGPYTYVSTLGTGHNPEIYKTGDTYVIYKIEPLGYYKSSTLGNSWETGEYTFDLRDRTLIAGENRETSLSNCSFAKREDGSFVMIDRGGGIWVSRDGLTDPWHQLTDKSVYLNSKITTRGSLEDPVIWRDHLQYHMIVNDWRARYAYYYRSLDGLHWTMEAGKAYTGQDPFAKHADGTVEAWHKYERPRVYQDEHGRAIRMNFAVIDCVKQSDIAGDDHSSKNINMPLTRQLLLEVQGSEAITSQTTSIRVLVKGEDGFNPRTDLNLSSLKFGGHDKVNYGNGFSYSSSENSGTSDLIITFTGDAGESGITNGEWAAKMLGKKTDGSIAFGYAKMPDIDYKPAMFSALTPAFSADGSVTDVNVTNYGQMAATATTVRIYAPNGTTLLAHGTTSALTAYASETVTLTKDNNAQAGYKSIQVRFYDGETLLNTENIPLTTINAAQTALQTVIDEAGEYYDDSELTNGKDALKTAIDAAKAVVTTYSVAAITEQQTALQAALNTFKYANASPTNGLEITIPNATMDAFGAWNVRLNKDDGDAVGWQITNNGTKYNGFEGKIMETWVNQNGALGVDNYARQTLTEMPAGRYRLRAQIIACRQNNADATTGVTLFANNQTTACKTANNTPTEFMVEINMTEAGPLTIGIDIPASTQANWVAWDNVTLKYFGTQEGDIVEEQPEPLTFDESKLYRIQWSDHKNYTKIYWRSPKYNTTGDVTLHRTANAGEAARFIIRNVANVDGQFYLYDTVSHKYVVPSSDSTNGTTWTVADYAPGKVVISENNDQFTISSTAGGIANAYANDNNDGDIRNYGSGSLWLIEAIGENTNTFGISPQAVYRIVHQNPNRYRYLAKEPSAEGYLLTTNTEADKGEFSLLPVSGHKGYYYIYNKEGYFVTPAAGNWTLSKTTPAEVLVTLNIDNMDNIPTTNATFLLGEPSQYANPQNKNNVELVNIYANKPLDRGNNWVLEPINDITAGLSLTAVKDNIQSLVQSAAAEDIPLSYTATVGTAGYSTLVVPFDADIEGNVEAYVLTYVNSSDAVTGNKVLTIEANKPVLLKGQGTLSLTSKSSTAAYSDTPVEGLLTGVYTTMKAPAGSYVLQNLSDGIGFYLVESGSEPTIKPFRAYLSIPGNSARRLTFNFGETTGVGDDLYLNNQENLTYENIYSINGTHQKSITRGLNIVRMSNGTTKKIYSR